MMISVFSYFPGYRHGELPSHWRRLSVEKSGGGSSSGESCHHQLGARIQPMIVHAYSRANSESICSTDSKATTYNIPAFSLPSI